MGDPDGTAQGRRVLFRWLAILSATAAVGMGGGSRESAVLVATLFLANAVAVHFVSDSARRRTRFGFVLLVWDISALALGFAAVREPLPAVAVLFVMLSSAVSLGSGRAWVAHAAVLGGYAVAEIGLAGPRLGGAVLLSRLAFLALAALYVHPLVRDAVERDDALAEARRESRELRAILEITDAVTGTLDVRQVMRLIVQRVGDLVHAHRCSILLVDEPRNNAFVMAASDDPDVDMLEIDVRKYPEILHAVETREPVIVRDVDNDPLVAEVREHLTSRGYRSLMVLPLVHGREVLGTMFLRASRERPFSAREIGFCRVAAGASANALKNSLLYREVAMEAARHRATGEKLRRVLDCTPDMIIATDADMRITEFNRGAVSVTGLTAESVSGRPLSMVLGTTPPFGGDSPGEADRAGLSPDTVLRRPDGEPVYVSFSSAPLTASEGEPAGRVWVGRDVTELRRAERSLAQAERLSSLGEVVAGVAHELNNPLSGVLGFAQLLQGQAHDARELRDLERIVDSARRCQRIVLNLLSFARKHPAEKRLQDVNACVSKVVELKSYHLRASMVSVTLDLDPALPEAVFDFHQIEQVVLNFLNNAEQAVAQTGRPGRVTLRTRAEGAFVGIEVEDDGPGVPPSIQDRVFDPFFTTKEPGQGTGLGLSVSYGIARDHGGRVELRKARTLGGACFAVLIPVASEAAADSAPAPAVEPVDQNSLKGRRILVAEDEPEVRDLFYRVLDAAGAKVTLAEDGQTAWERILDADFDLIVTDLRMPNLDGQELYQKAAAERPELIRKFVFATGDMVRQETLRFLERLPNRVLAKPLDVETLRRVLSQAAS